MRTVGLDIGGANLKASDGREQSVSVSFPLWRHPEQLAAVLRELLSGFGAVDRLAITMTGELADCYATRADGVQQILTAAEQAGGTAQSLVWCSAGEFLTASEAREFPSLVAAANWHALATWAGRLAPEGEAILLDLGSTTLDVIPLECGLPMTAGRTDPERLQSGELVYVGVKRTPLIGLMHEVELEGRRWPLANELFATTWDAGLLLGEQPAEPDSRSTANGRPATPAEAATRLARQLCADETDLSPEQLRLFAQAVTRDICRKIEVAINRIWRGRSLSAWILSGEGTPLLREVLEGMAGARDTVYELSQLVGAEHSRSACAYALARLGQEWD